MGGAIGGQNHVGGGTIVEARNEAEIEAGLDCR